MGEGDEGKREEMKKVKEMREKRMTKNEGNGMERRICNAYQLEFSG